MHLAPGELTLLKFAKTRPETYPQLQDFIEKERPEWLQSLMPRRINAPANYWPQKVLPLSTILAAMTNHLLLQGGMSANSTFVAVEGQMAHLLQFDVPTFYVSSELIFAAARTDLPTDMLLEAVPFPFEALVFMFPKGTIHHPSQGDCPYVVVSRTRKGQEYKLPLKDVTFGVTVERPAITVSTYLPNESQCYHKTIDIFSEETMKSAFERASKIPYEISGGTLPDAERALSTTDGEFIDLLWLLGMTLVLIMASGENLLEPGTRLKTIKPKKPSDQPVDYWSPSYLGRVYKAKTDSQSGDPESQLRPHWRKGHLKSQPHGPRSALRKTIWIQPYRTGR
jgi:hypothetical protein